jgi:phosphoribosylglycinamide formyltransferase 1
VEDAGVRKRIAVLASGGGSNLQALLDHFAVPPASGVGEIVLVASDRAACGALDRARARDVAAVSCAPSDLARLLQEHRIDLVALAGYLRFIPREVTEAYAGRMINIHPSLLPDHGGAGMYGKRVHESVLRSGATRSGATVHFVSDEYDRGPIIAQREVPVLPDDTPETLGARVLAVEHELFPQVLEDLAAGRLAYGPRST